MRFTSITAPLLDGEIDDRHAVVAARGTGVVHDDVDSPELVQHALRERLDRVGVGHVADDGERAAAERAHLVGDRVDVAPSGLLLVVGVALDRATGAGQHDVAPGAGELDRDGAADRAHAPRAGHHRDLVVESGEKESAHAGSLTDVLVRRRPERSG